MRIHTITVLAISGLLLTAAGCETAPRAAGDGPQHHAGAPASQQGSDADGQPAADEHAPIETSTATMIVHGMGCPLCANNVDKQLEAVRGVDRVNVNLGTGMVRVHLSDADRPSRAQLRRAVDESGFTLVRLSTP